TGNTDYILSYEMTGTSAPNGGMNYAVGAFMLNATTKPHAGEIGSIDGAMMRVGDSKTLPLYMKVDGELCDLAGATDLTASVEDGSIAAVSVNQTDKSISITGRAVGNTTVKVSMKCNGVLASTQIPVKIKYPTYKYNYHKLRKSRDTSIDPKTLTSFEQTRAFTSEEINKGLSEAETDPFMYGENSDGVRFGYASSAYGAMLSGATADKYYALKLEVLAGGSFAPVCTYGAWGSGGIVNMYLAKDNDPNPRADGNLIGTIDSYTSGSPNWATEKMLDTVELTAGTYILTYKVTGKNAASSAMNFAVGSFELREPPTNSFAINVANAGGLYTGDDAEYEITGRYNNRPLDMGLDEVVVSAVSESPEFVTATSEKRGGKAYVKVHGVALGTAIVKASVTYQGATKEKSFEVKVSPADFEYNFLKVGFKEYGKGIDITTVTDFGMTTAGSPNEINPDAPLIKRTDPWIYVDQGNGRFYYTDTTYGCMMEGGPGAWATMKIRVPVAGKYLAKAHLGLWSNSGIVRIYLAPGDAENPRSSRYLLNTIDCYKTKPYDWVAKIPLRNVTLEKGDYYISYETVGKNPAAGGNDIPIGGIYLKEPGESTFSILADDSKRIMQGASQNTEIFANIDGEAVNFNDITDLTVEVDDKSIAGATIVKSTDGTTATVKFNGLKTGKTKAIVKGTANGLPATCEMPIEVVKPDALDRAELTADKTTLSSGEQVASKLTVYCMDGSTIDLSKLAVYYESGDARIAAVDAAGNIMARDRGTTNISAFVKVGETMCRAELAISVSSSSPISTAELSIPTKVEAGESIALKVVGKLVSGSSYSSETAATYSIVSAEPADCAAIVSGKLVTSAVGSV
ncbi:MAG: hypothetical protein RSC43_06365, partial [Clostridia bacterium]